MRQQQLGDILTAGRVLVNGPPSPTRKWLTLEHLKLASLGEEGDKCRPRHLAHETFSDERSDFKGDVPKSGFHLATGR